MKKLMAGGTIDGMTVDEIAELVAELLRLKAGASVPTGGLMTVTEFLNWARIGRTSFYKAVSDNQIQIVKFGRKSLVPRHSAEAWARSLPVVGQRQYRRDQRIAQEARDEVTTEHGSDAGASTRTT